MQVGISSRRIADELQACADRTGWTEALDKAAARLPDILTMTPWEFERYSVEAYSKLV